MLVVLHGVEAEGDHCHIGTKLVATLQAEACRGGRGHRWHGEGTDDVGKAQMIWGGCRQCWEGTDNIRRAQTML